MNPSTRMAIYAVMASVLALLTTYGVIAQEQVGLWLDLTTNVLALAALVLAARHVPRGADR